MKSIEVLTGIATRAIASKPIEPRFTTLPYDEEADGLSMLTRDLREEFPSLFSGNDEIDDVDVAKFDGLFAWLAIQLRSFPDGAPVTKRRLVDILALATMLECDAELWGELAKAVPNPSPHLIDAFATIFADTRADGRKLLKWAGYNSTQISNALDDIARKNWKSVEWTMDRLREILWLPLKSHAAAALHQYDSPRLESLLEDSDDLFEIAAYILHAPVAQMLKLALTSKNWMFKFWAFHKSVKYARADEPTYSVEWEALLTQAASEPAEWDRWLAVLNEYPSRYPVLQPVLGNTLVGISDEALDAYVASVSTAADIDRPQLTTALTVFRAKAPLASRQRLWTAAFKRWEQWDFGCDEQPKSLLRVAKSSFDFSVIGYLTECLSEEARAEIVAKLEVRAAAIERDWHTDITRPMTERFKLISTYQLLAHAKAVWAAAGFTDTEFGCDDETGGEPWEREGYSAASTSLRL